METDTRQLRPETPCSRPCEPDSLSVKEAAEILGVSERSVYGYLKTGRLAGKRIEKHLVVNENEVRAFERKAPGRMRTGIPPWRVPPEANRLFLTMIMVRVRPGQQHAWADKLRNIHREGAHRFPGTVARYIAQHQDDPNEIEMILVCRAVVQPSKETWRSALAALCADLADVLDWDTATLTEGQGLLHA